MDGVLKPLFCSLFFVCLVACTIGYRDVVHKDLPPGKSVDSAPTNKFIVKADGTDQYHNIIKAIKKEGVLRLPPGRIRWSGKVDLTVSVYGSGMWETLLEPMNGDSAFFLRGRNLELADFAFVVDKTYPRTPSTWGLISFDDSANFIDGLKVSRVGADTKDHGPNVIFLKSRKTAYVRDIEIEGLDIRSCGRMGVEVFGKHFSNIHIHNNKIEHCGQAGEIGMGVSIASQLGSENIRVHDNSFSNNNYTDIEVAGNMDNVDVYNNEFFGGSKTSIVSSGGLQTNISIHHNTDRSNDGEWKLFSIEGKVFDNKILKPLILRCHGSRFYNNEIRTNRGSAVVFEGATNNHFVDNLISNSYIDGASPLIVFRKRSFGNSISEGATGTLTKASRGKFVKQYKDAFDNKISRREAATSPVN